MTPTSPARFRPRCVRLEDRLAPAAGQLDPTFGTGGSTTTYVRFQPAAEVPLPNGQYLAAGTTESLYLTDFALARFNADGSLDPTFAKGGYAGLDFDNSYDFAADLAVQPDGKILVVGSSAATGKAATQRFAAARFNADGTLDPAFGAGGKVAVDVAAGDGGFAQVQAAAVLAGGQILLAGAASSPAGPMRVTLVRLNPDGGVDATFGTGGVARPDPAYAYAPVVRALSDGRVAVIGPAPGAAPQPPTLALVRPDGTFDPAFARTTLPDVYAQAVALQPDGRVVVAGGWYTDGARGSDFVLVRLSAGGGLDAGFGVNGRVATDFQQQSDAAYAVALQPDGTILVGGASGQNPIPVPLAAGSNLTVPYAAAGRFALARYHADGALDTSFGALGRAVTPSTTAHVNRLVVQPDGQIMAVGPVQLFFFYPLAIYPGNSYLNGGLTFARFDGTGPRRRLSATGADAGGGPHVQAFDEATGQLRLSFLAFDPQFLGGVRVATGDVTGDGVDDVVAAAGPGGGPEVRVFDGRDGRLLRAFQAYDPHFLGGVNVAVGDITGDGRAEILTAPEAGGGPHVRIFDGPTAAVLDQFMAYDPGFLGGVRLAAGDVNGDGLMDVVTGAGPGGGPHVRVFDEAPALVNPAYPPQRAQLANLFAFDAGYTGGLFVAAGDVTGDGAAELVVSQGGGTNAVVAVLRAADGAVMAATVPFDGAPVRGARVAVTDPDFDGRGQVLVGAGPDRTRVQARAGATLAVEGEFTAYDPAFQGGVFVG